MMFSLPYTFFLHFHLNNIHIFDYPDTRLYGLFSEVPRCPANRGSTAEGGKAPSPGLRAVRDKQRQDRPTRGFGYMVSGALFIQVYGIFCHNSGVKYLVFPGF